jgi:germination protein M
MRKFFYLLVLTGVMLLCSCQIPVDKISEDDTVINNTDIEADNMNTKEATETNDEAGSINKAGSTNEAGSINAQKRAGDITGNEENISNAQIPMIAVTGYYKDSSGTLIPVTRNIEKEEGIAKAAIRSLVHSEQNIKFLEAKGLSPVLPEDTTVLGMSIKEGTAVVDFSESLLNYENRESEQDVIACIVYTLTEFGTIDGVKILINGHEKEVLKYGTDISGILTRDNILINTSKVNLEDKTKKLDLYLFKYINEKYEYILPVSVEYIGVNDNQIPKEIISLLSKDYSSKNIYSQLPRNVELLDSRIEDKVLVLDFNSEIRSYGGTAREEAILKQVLYSMKQIDGVEKVKMLIEGKSGHLPEGTDISREMVFPEEINSFRI